MARPILAEIAGAARRLAWVTGGSAGIGLAIARCLCDMGYRVIISARDAGALEQACDDLKAAGGEAECIAVDVADRKAVNAAAAEVLSRHGRIDVLINNAGFNSQKRKWDELIPEEFDAVIAANLTGTFNAIHAVLPTMRVQRDGLVINISSVAGKQVNPDGGLAYSSTAGLDVNSASAAVGFDSLLTSSIAAIKAGTFATATDYGNLQDVAHISMTAVPALRPRPSMATPSLSVPMSRRASDRSMPTSSWPMAGRSSMSAARWHCWPAATAPGSRATSSMPACRSGMTS